MLVNEKCLSRRPQFMAFGDTEGEQCSTHTSIGFWQLVTHIHFQWTDFQTFSHLHRFLEQIMAKEWFFQVQHACYFCNPEYSTRGSSLPLAWHDIYIVKLMHMVEILRWRCLGLFILKTTVADRTHLSSNLVGFVHNNNNDNNDNYYNNDNNDLQCSKVRCFGTSQRVLSMAGLNHYKAKCMFMRITMMRITLMTIVQFCHELTIQWHFQSRFYLKYS